MGIVETLADTLLALILAEQAPSCRNCVNLTPLSTNTRHSVGQAQFQSLAQGLIAQASAAHQAPLGAMFTTLVSGNGLSGQYTRPQKMAFRTALKAFAEQAGQLVASTATPIIQPPKVQEEM